MSTTSTTIEEPNPIESGAIAHSQTVEENLEHRAKIPEPMAPIVILNQYYVPDVASTGYLLHELATELVRLGYDVSATTCRPSYGPKDSWVDCPLKEKLNGVNVRRMSTTRFRKDSYVGRGINYMTFIVQLALRMLFTSSPKKVYLYTTNPPFLGVIGAFVSLFRRHNYVVLLHDAYPQLAVWVGAIKAGGMIEKIWHKANHFAYHRAMETIVLCEAAKELVCAEYGIAPEKVHVIPNWADGSLLKPMPKSESQFAAQENLTEPFTLMYSGNLGLCYEYETILDAAEILLDSNFRLVWVGSGGNKAWLTEQIKKRGLTNTTMHPYQPFDMLRDSLAACDASLVTIAQGVEGMSYPSKLYSSVAMGLPVIAISESKSELRDIVEQRDIGRWFNLGDGEGMANGIKEMMQDRDRCVQQGINARELFEERFTRAISAQSYAKVLNRAARKAKIKKGAEPKTA